MTILHDQSGNASMASRIRDFDWERGPAGLKGEWPRSLRTMVSFMLDSIYPMYIAWGPELLLLYNDAYARILGEEEPRALARPLFEVRPEIADELRPLVATVLSGTAVHHTDPALSIGQTANRELRSSTFSFTSVRDHEDRIAGFFCTISETIDAVPTIGVLKHGQGVAGQLADGLAHDFNNVFAAIGGSLEMLQSRLSTGNVEPLDRYARAARDGVDRAAAMTQRLLAFLRYEILDPKRTDISRLVSDMEKLVSPAAGRSEPSVPDASHERSADVVLIVDDEPTIRMLVAESLTDDGYVTFEASAGGAALKVLRSLSKIDLLITDVGLPGGLDGRQVADAARTLHPQLKVLFITGYAENAVFADEHLPAGMQVLTKPFSIEALTRTIRTMIES